VTTLRALLLAWVATTACAGESAPAAEVAQVGVPSASLGAELPLGRTLVYALAWTVEAGFEAGSPLGLPLAGGLHLEGELHVQALEPRDGGTLAAIWFNALSVGELSVNGERIDVGPAALVGQRAYFIIDRSGAVTRTWFGPDATPLFQQVMSGALARFDLQGATGAGTHVVRTGHGLAEVTYARTGEAGAVRRDLQRMVRFDSFAGVEPERAAVEGVADLALDADRIPLAIDSREDAAVADEGWSFGSHDRFRASRTRIDDGPPLAIPNDFASYVEHDPQAPPDPSEAERVLAQRFAGELEVRDVAIAVKALDGGLLPGPGFASQATGLLRGWPDEAREMIPVALSASGHGRQLAFDLLSSAGTTQAQTVMIELLERDDVREWPEFPLLVGRFAFVYRPTAQTAQFLLALQTEARADGRDVLARAALYPLGSVARSIEPTDPWLTELLHARLVEELAAAADPPERIAAIAGLGNLSRLADRGLLLTLLADPDDGVRAHAVTALRNMVAPDTTAALITALRDPDTGVASNALDVLANHHLGPDGSAQLAAIIIAGEYNLELDTAIVNALAFRVADDPSVSAALRALASRVRDHEILRRIEQLVGT